MMVPDELLSFLNNYFSTDRYPETEQGGIYRVSDRPVYRLGVALEPDAALSQWVSEQHLDALWLHRPWQLSANALPSGVSVLYHHLPFDETLTMGFNRPLADALGMPAPQELGYKQADSQSPKRAIGMLGDSFPRESNDWITWIKQTFGGYERVQPGQVIPGRPVVVNRIAVVGAMNEALIREAAERGARLYITGQYRKSVQAVVDETGMAVIAVGHRRSEEWGLMALATVLARQFSGLTVITKKSGQPED